MLLTYENIVGSILQVVDTICINISSAIYNVIGFLYQIFMALASAQIFTSDQYQNISKNVYYIIGVVALFLISYALLRAIINPDGGGKSEYAVSKIVPNVLKAIILIAFVPALFSIAYRVQNVVIATNVIPKIVLGKTYNDGKGTSPNGKELDFKTVGRTTANIMFKAFLYPSSTDKGQSYAEEEIEASDCYASYNACSQELLNGQKYSFKQASDAVESGDLDFAVYANYARFIHGKPQMLEYNGILQIVAGIFAAYIFLNYCIDLGVRAVKLGYYQVIAPLPILTILIPGQSKVFNSWLKSTLSTFAEVFIKIAILFFGLLLIQNLPDFKNLWTDSIFGEPSVGVANFAKVFLIIGILIFIKQAPKLLSDLFGIQAGSFKLGLKDKLGEMAGIGGVTKSTLDSAQGGITGALGAGWTAKRNGLTFADGAKYGFANGWKGKGNQFNKQRQQIYSKAFDGEGKVGIFGTRSYFDQMGAQINKDTKNAYRQRNFERVLGYENSEDFQNMYKEEYAKQAGAVQARMAAVQERRDREIADYNARSNSLKERIAAGKEIESRISENEALVANGEAGFASAKSSAMARLDQELRNAEASGDTERANSIRKRREDLQNRTYNDARRLLDEAKANRVDVSSLENQLNRVETQRMNDASLDAADKELEELGKQLSSYKDEYDYVMNGTRSFKTEQDRQIDGKVTSILSNTRAAYQIGNAEYADVIKSHASNVSEEAAKAYAKTPEAQRAAAVFGMGMDKFGKSGAAPEPPKSDSK